MNRKRILTAALFVLMIGLVIWMFSLRPKDSLASLVPEHASWYLEVDKPTEVLKTVQRGIHLFGNPDLTLFSEWQKELDLADLLFKKEKEIYNYVRNTTLGISAHAITGKEVGYVFYFSVPEANQARFFELLRKQFGNDPQYRFVMREYLGKSIAEVTFRKTGAVFSVAGSNDALIGSFSGFLVEEVVRRSGIFFKPNFASRLSKDSRYAGIASRPLRLFVQLKNAPEFLFHYLSGSLQAIRLSGNLGECLLLGFDNPDGLEMKSEGYVLSETTTEQQKHKIPLDPILERFIPEPEMLSFHCSGKELWNQFPGKKTGFEGQNDLLGKALEDEMLIGLAEGDGLKKYNHLLITKIKKAEILTQFLQSVDDPNKTELFREQYHQYWIQQHSNSGISGILGGSVLENWVPFFYVVAGDYFIASDEVETLRRSLDHFIETAAGKGPGSIPHHFRFRMNPSKSVPFLMEAANGPFRKHFSEWVSLLKSMDKLELSDLGEEENPSVTFTAQWKLKGIGNGQIHELKRIFLDSVVTTPPIRLETRTSELPYWMVQDLKKQAHLLSPQLSEVFRLPMPEKWVSKPQIVEEKSASAFSVVYTMPHSIQMSDQKGVMKPGFVIQIPDSQSTIEHARVIDYDQSRQYRLFIASRYGPVFAAEMNRNFLDGWRPWNHNNALAFAPRHIRIGVKDLILMLDNMGNLMVTNRKGEMQPGFPFRLNGRTNQPLFVEYGLDLKNSFVYSLSELGQMEKISFQGVATSAIQLFRPDKETRFMLCPDQKQRTFAVCRITASQITVFDQSYRPVFDYPTKSKNILVQHFQFGASNKIYAIVDLEARLCTLFDESGTAILQNPIEATQPIDLIRKPGSDQEFLLISAFENRLSLSEFSKE